MIPCIVQFHEDLNTDIKYGLGNNLFKNNPEADRQIDKPEREHVKGCSKEFVLHSL